jgi:protease IV
MWEFLKKLHLTVFGLCMTFFVVLLIMLIVGLFSGGESNKTILKITLNSPLAELSPGDETLAERIDLPFSNFESNCGVINTVQALKKAKTDAKIASVFLDLGMIQGGLGAVEEIRNAIIDFRTSGKKVIAYGDYYDEKAYYLASAADSVFLTEEGLLEFNGFVAEVNFYKKTLNNIGIKPKIFRVGRFKGAVEPFMLDSMSKENRLQINEFITSLHTSMLSQVAESRNIPFETLKTISDQLLVRNPIQAKEKGLIDDVKYYDQVLDLLRKVSGISASEKMNFTTPESYWSSESAGFGDEIAVIVADGEINMGKNKKDVIGSNGMAKLIREARQDANVKAIVLRINSPGGSALGSDLMWREIKLASESKPVIASMSNVAASGGYYMAMACDTIVAQKTTITGSIGVFGMLFEANELLEKKIGIHTDRVKTGQFSDLGTPTRNFTTADSLIIQTEINEIYKKFITKAAAGRKMSYAALDNVASGRVWSGLDAQKIGLVDVFGGLEVAIQIAAQKINKKVTDCQVLYYPTTDPFWGTLESGYKKAMVPDELKELQQSDLYLYYKHLISLKNMQGVQAKLPYTLSIK